ncbi:hypothetical protein [Desulfosarcina ovata]|uniref:hypothetical protein n=1 Tax=Desulfosarcina ovata TaxID=83564 RepID=UPI0012D35292|nr:hypothetical protein [Desulfosarcina ovata]
MQNRRVGSLAVWFVKLETGQPDPAGRGADSIDGFTSMVSGVMVKTMMTAFFKGRVIYSKDTAFKMVGCICR